MHHYGPYAVGQSAVTHSTTLEVTVMAEWPRVAALSVAVVAVHSGALYAAGQLAATHSTTLEVAVEAN